MLNDSTVPRSVLTSRYLAPQRTIMTLPHHVRVNKPSLNLDSRRREEVLAYLESFEKVNERMVPSSVSNE